MGAHVVRSSFTRQIVLYIEINLSDRTSRPNIDKDRVVHLKLAAGE